MPDLSEFKDVPQETVAPLTDAEVDHRVAQLQAKLADEIDLQAEIERLRAALEAAAKTMRNARGHIETGQIVDKETRCVLREGENRARRALSDKTEGSE